MINVFKGSILLNGSPWELSQDLANAINGVKKALRNGGMPEVLVEAIVNDAVRMANMTEAERNEALCKDVKKLFPDLYTLLEKMTGKKDGGNTNDQKS